MRKLGMCGGVLIAFFVFGEGVNPLVRGGVGLIGVVMLSVALMSVRAFREMY